ncbi:MAG TPA: DinB family protein [Candidatus Angelobacter sp.]|nr:DinB family protein [Candidatus Angelobacter sp.]
MADDGHVVMFADDERLEALAAYTDHLDDLAAVFADANAGDGELLDRRPGPDAWSVAEVLHHLADAELHQSVRLRQMLVGVAPVWAEWDEEAYAATLGYDVRPAADALTLLLAMRHVNVRLLASMSPELWTRTAVHPSQGVVDVAGWVRIANDHLAAHVLQARRAVVGML